MLLTVTTTHQPATDLGYLLRKNPVKAQSFGLTFGRAHVFYPEATAERCTVALLVEVDPVGLVRNRRGPAGGGGALEQYVNQRPYAASSFRHRDHRFERTRAEFQVWARRVSERFGYQVRFVKISMKN
jgi:hypothetical protein